MSLEFTIMNKNLSQSQGSTLVLFTPELGKTKKLHLNLKSLPKDLIQNASEAFLDSPYKGTPSDILFFRQFRVFGFSNILFVGLGDLKKVTHETIRRASSIAFKMLKANSIKSATLAIDTLPLNAKDKEANLNGLFEGFYLSEYNFDTFKSGKKEEFKMKLHAV